MTRGVLSAEDVTVRYGRVAAVREVTTTFRARAITAIVGPSGCGKTSFLSTFNRMTDLIPGCDVTGRVTLDGRDVRQTDAVDLRRRVGMIFQEPNPFPASIRTNLELPLREVGERDPATLADRSEDALRVVGLWKDLRDRLHQPATDLSGGQRQRLCLARALTLDPEVLLMDEPCSALDPGATEVIEGLIRDLRDRCTVLIVTHHLAQARRIADEVAVFWSEGGPGTLIEQGPTDAMFGGATDERTVAYLQGVRG